MLGRPLVTLSALVVSGRVVIKPPEWRCSWGVAGGKLDDTEVV